MGEEPSWACKLETVRIEVAFKGMSMNKITWGDCWSFGGISLYLRLPGAKTISQFYPLRRENHSQMILATGCYAE